MLSLPYIVELSKLDAIKSVNALKAEVDALRPLATETEQRIMQKLRLDWNYHSNSIEGNQLDYGETVAFLMHGLTAKGKPLKDHLDIRGHNEAILFLTSLVKDERGISEADIRALHKLILVEPYEVDALTPEGNPTKKWIRLGEYKRESNSVKTRTGETHFYATPEETPARMTDLMAWYQEAKTVAGIHPLVVAALFHHEFTAIHPFDDGNGRMARLLSNLILMQSSFPPVVVKKEDRNSYYSVLSQADAGSFASVVDYFGQLLAHSLNIYLRGAKGGTIEEETDIDKEIALFKAGFDKKYKERAGLSAGNLKTTFDNSISLILKELKDKFVQFDDMFVRINSRLRLPENTILFSATSGWDDSFDGNLEKSTNEILTYFSETIQNKNRLIALQYLHIWYGFRMNKIPFDLSFRLSFLFQENKYSIFINENKNPFISFFYNEIPENFEIVSLINECAKQVLSDVKQKANEP